MISVVIPVLNEEENIKPLVAEISAASVAGAPVEEIIYVDDGSTDGTLTALKALQKNKPPLRIIRHDRSCGQSEALWSGIQAARSELIVTLDGDGQNNPKDIILLYNAYQANIAKSTKVMVAGQRAKRNDNWIRRISSRVANSIRANFLKDGTRDTGCSLKLFRREDYVSLPYFRHMHRFLPALMMREGVRIIHVDVLHRARHHGASKYGTLDRLFVALADLRGVRWLQKRARLYPVITEDSN